MAHFCLTRDLLPLLRARKGRVISVSSALHRWAKPNFADMQATHHYSGVRAYANAKLFQIYFTRMLIHRTEAEGVSAYALHPGVVKTHFADGLSGRFKKVMNWITPFMISDEQGAETSVYRASAPDLKAWLNGRYFVKSKSVQLGKLAASGTAMHTVWFQTEALLRQLEF